jgi:hypothetical protein
MKGIAMPERTAYAVAGLKPFWRWAVAMDERPDLPAIPYYRKADALAFYDDSALCFPERTTVLLRRRLRARVEVIKSSSSASRKDRNA